MGVAERHDHGVFAGGSVGFPRPVQRGHGQGSAFALVSAHTAGAAWAKAAASAPTGLVRDGVNMLHAGVTLEPMGEKKRQKFALTCPDFFCGEAWAQ